MTADLRTDLQATLGDDCLIARELGGGGMSRVFIADDAALRRRIVVKVLPPEMAGAVSIARFQREIAVAARLQHPHIVPLLSVGETQGLPYYVMPFVEGETLRDRLARGGELPMPEAVRVLREIATALGYAHEKGVVHRDIKPENILLSGGIALVTDFGVAKALLDAATSNDGALTGTGVSVGTPAYMSPEQVSADPGVDHRADIYAFGMVAYEMLAGQSPFAGRTAQALLAAHVIDAPEPLQRRRPSVPPALAALVMRCLAKRPADRPQQASEIVHALDALATPTQTVAWRGSPRTTLRMALMSAVVIATVLALGWLRFGRHGAPPAATPRLLIAPFVNLTGDARFDNIGRIVADRLSQRVAQYGSMDVVPSMTVLMALRDTTGGEMKRLQALSAATHASLVISGTIVLRGDSLLLQGQGVNARTGELALTLVPAVGTRSDPITAVDAFGDRLLGALGRSREMVVLPRGYRAPKYAAYQQFAEGFERFAVQGDNLGSRPFFERAIALDSSYVAAYQLLTRQYINAGEFDRADSMAQRMEHLPQGLTATERLQLDQIEASVRGDLAAQLRVNQQLVARDSSSVALGLLGMFAGWMLRPDLAVPALEASDPAMRLLGGSALRSHTNDLSEAYHESGQYDRQLALQAGAMRSLRAYAGLAQPAAALAMADSLMRAIVDTSGVILVRLSTGAAEFRAHGDSVTASRLLAMARAWMAQHPAPGASRNRLMMEGNVLLASGSPDSAAVQFASAARMHRSLDVAGYLALAQIAAGKRDAARATADSLGALHQRWLFGENTFWRAAITGALGEREVAVNLLRDAHQEGRPMQNWHYHEALASLHGYAPFEALVRPRR